MTHNPGDSVVALSTIPPPPLPDGQVSPGIAISPAHGRGTIEGRPPATSPEMAKSSSYLEASPLLLAGRFNPLLRHRGDPLASSQPTLEKASSRPHAITTPVRHAITERVSKASKDSLQIISAPLFGSPLSLSSIAENMYQDRGTSNTPSVSSETTGLDLLEAARMDLDPYYCLSKEGTVEAGTLEGLISRLFVNRTGVIRTSPPRRIPQ